MLLVRRSTRTLSLTDEGGKLLVARPQHPGGCRRQRGRTHRCGARSERPAPGQRLLVLLAPPYRAAAAGLPRPLSERARARRSLEPLRRPDRCRVDVAIRTREFEPDRAITIRRLAETRRILTAAPSYLARAGTPLHPRDLAQHALLLYIYANNPNELGFSRGAEMVRVAGTRPARIERRSDLRAAALNGHGILVQPTYIVTTTSWPGASCRPRRLGPAAASHQNSPTRPASTSRPRSGPFIAFVAADFESNAFTHRWTGATQRPAAGAP